MSPGVRLKDTPAHQPPCPDVASSQPRLPPVLRNAIFSSSCPLLQQLSETCNSLLNTLWPTHSVTSYGTGGPTTGCLTPVSGGLLLAGGGGWRDSECPPGEGSPGTEDSAFFHICSAPRGLYPRPDALPIPHDLQQTPRSPFLSGEGLPGQRWGIFRAPLIPQLRLTSRRNPCLQLLP